MTTRRLLIALSRNLVPLWLIAVLFALPAHAEPGFINRVGSVFDGIARGLNLVGKKSEDLVAPRIGVPPAAVRADFSGLVQDTREFRESYPLQRNATLSVVNSFGEIRIDSWDSQVVRVVAHITAGAPSAAIASDVVQRIDINVSHAEDLIRVESILPDTRQLGRVPIEVDYYITVPRDINVLSENTFGDTFVYGITGGVTVDSRFGAVNIEDIAGLAKVYAKGQFPVNARDLEQGGFFELSDSTATLSRIGGKLELRSYLGATEIRELAPQCQIDAACDSGSLVLYLDEDEAPDLTATALFGDIQSDLELNRTARGEAVVARRPQDEAAQRVSLHTSFGSITVRRAGNATANAQPAAVADELVKQGPQEISLPYQQGMTLDVDAAVGDVRIEGIDGDTLHVSFTRLARVTSPDRAQTALKALSAAAVLENNTARVTTAANADMAALGCTAYRIDVVLRVPRTLPVRVHARSGHIAISDLDETLAVVQEEGALSVEHVNGALDLKNGRGDVRVLDCAGPAAIDSAFGSILARNVLGPLNAACVEGEIVVDAPQGPVTAHCRGGGIRVLALERIGGDYDLQAENGGLSIVLPPTADATLVVTAENGAIHSSVPLTGTIQSGLQKFMGQLNNGGRQIQLSTKGGDLSIN